MPVELLGNLVTCTVLQNLATEVSVHLVTFQGVQLWQIRRHEESIHATDRRDGRVVRADGRLPLRGRELRHLQRHQVPQQGRVSRRGFQVRVSIFAGQ